MDHNYSLRPTQDDRIFEWHEILRCVVWWNKVERKKLVEYFNEERGERMLFSKLENDHFHLGRIKKER